MANYWLHGSNWNIISTVHDELQRHTLLGTIALWQTCTAAVFTVELLVCPVLLIAYTAASAALTRLAHITDLWWPRLCCIFTKLILIITRLTSQPAARVRHCSPLLVLMLLQAGCRSAATSTTDERPSEVALISVMTVHSVWRNVVIPPTIHAHTPRTHMFVAFFLISRRS